MLKGQSVRPQFPMSDTAQLRLARPADIDAILALIAKHREQLLARSPSDIEALLDTFWVVEEDGEIAGCCCLEVYSPKIAEVRSLAVRERSRGRQYGTRLVAAAVGEAKRRGIPQVLAVTSNVEFFAQQHFQSCLNEKYALFWEGPDEYHEGTAMTTSAFGLQQIGQIAVIVKDVARATAFYRDVLGMRFLFDYPGMAFFDCGGVRLYLTAPQEPSSASGGTSILYYRVPDIDAAHRELSGRGVEFAQPPRKIHEDARHELWLASFRDSEGNTLCLMQERVKADA